MLIAKQTILKVISTGGKEVINVTTAILGAPW